MPYYQTQKPKNFLALTYKIPNISSLGFTNAIKRSLNLQGFGIKKMGFLGTLDPFACGQLIMASNSHTKILNHINLGFKTYKAVIFLGMKSQSLDSESAVVSEFSLIKKPGVEKILSVLDSINRAGSMEYLAPRFSAKHIGGVRAYKLAREGVHFKRPLVKTQVKNIKLLNYCHPFLSFQITLSTGGYVRSIAQIIVENLGACGALCYLERVSESKFNYKKILDSITFSKKTDNKIISTQFLFKDIKQEAKLIIVDIKNALDYDRIKLLDFCESAKEGAKIRLDSQRLAGVFQADDFLESREPKKRFLADFGEHFAIIDIYRDGKVEYILNRIDKC